MGKVIMSGIVPQLVAPVTGILASDIAVGSTVKLMENGSPVEYLVVNQGIPSNSSLYDASCDGTWLLRKDCYELRPWDTSNGNQYQNSSIHSYLNSTFLNQFSHNVQSAILQVKIPYAPNGGNDAQVSYGEIGLPTKVFLISVIEIGFNYYQISYAVNDGACLSYFEGTSQNDSKRIGLQNGSAVYWYLRSKYTQGGVHYIDSAGGLGHHYSNNASGIRPALILKNTALFDPETLILKGVS